MRPKQFQYLKLLEEHQKTLTGFSYPRQLEIHLPGDHKRPCNAHCQFCEGRNVEKKLAYYEETALDLLENLKGAIKYHIYAGDYTEPMINPYFISFIAKTKKYKGNFGVYTNGMTLLRLEQEQGLLTELNRLSNENDYVVISLDAGSSYTWSKTKGISDFHRFWEIISGIEKMVKMKRTHKIRINYILTDTNDSLADIDQVVYLSKYLNIDSLRFTIPYQENGVRSKDYSEVIKPYLSDKVFYMGNEYVDPTKFNFNRCKFGLYEITLGADGYFHRCCKSSNPRFKPGILGKVTSDIKEFQELIKKNQDNNWDCRECFKSGITCDKAGLEINTHLYA